MCSLIRASKSLAEIFGTAETGAASSGQEAIKNYQVFWLAVTL